MSFGLQVYHSTPVYLHATLYLLKQSIRTYRDSKLVCSSSLGSFAAMFDNTVDPPNLDSGYLE